MNKYVRTLAGIVLASSIVLNGVTVFAADDKYTPTGIAYGDIGSSIEKWADDNPNKYVSFVTSVFDKDEIIYEGAFGYCDRENNIAAETDSVYEWGSVTKLTAWVSVMQLYEQGKIDLDRDIREYLPDGFLQNLKYNDPITMMNLMNHNAGWGEGTWALQTSDPEQIVSLGEALRATEPPQMYRPGEVMSYSNWGAALAGYIVECITGQSFADYVHENIFEPLGMEHTAILPDHSDNAWVKEQRENLVSYNFDGETWNANGKELIYINLYPAGSATGTISDMAKFAQSFVSDECPLFEKPETRDLFLSPSAYLGDTDIATCYHGLWDDNCETALLLGHSGSTNACSSHLYFDPETGLGYVYMTAGGRPDVRTILFGKRAARDLSGYSSAITNPGGVAGTYTGTRSIRRGIYKIYSLLDMVTVTYTSDNEYHVGGMATIKQYSDGVIEMSQSDSYPGYVYETSDATKIITLGSQSFAEDKTIIPSLVLLVIFIVMAFAGVLMLLFKFIGFIAKKRESYKGSLFITLSQLFRIFVLIPPIALATKCTEQYGLTHTQGYIFFGVEMACFIVFAATLISSVTGLISKSEEAGPKWKYIMSILGNAVAIAMMLLLEFLNITGI